MPVVQCYIRRLIFFKLVDRAFTSAVPIHYSAASRRSRHRDNANDSRTNYKKRLETRQCRNFARCRKAVSVFKVSPSSSDPDPSSNTMLSQAVLIIALASTIHKARAQDDEAIWNSVSSFFVPSAIEFLILRADYSQRELNVDSMLYWSSVRSVPSPSRL
jgi:hypothetical protein